jgi:hypothetical protein
MEEIVTVITSIILVLTTVIISMFFLAGLTVVSCSPQISIWSSLQNNTLKKDYTQLNDELNITFYATTFPMNYEIIHKKDEKSVTLLSGQTNNTSYSVSLKLNDTGLLYIEAVSLNCKSNSRIIEILTPSQHEFVSVTEQISQIRRELELERNERKEEANRTFIISLFALIISFASLLVSIIKFYSESQKDFRKKKV